ncbi:MAG TPA: ATP-binding protein [Thermoanaerobaculia bacterium]|nr:ATP-binding protein [Thermoanaerobaculia bacterium]
MTWRSAAVTLTGMLLAVAVLLGLFERRISAAWFRLGHHPEVVVALEQSRDDQKTLARLDPERRQLYRQRFDEIETLHQRLLILEHNRLGIAQRYQWIVLSVVGGVLLAAGGFQIARQRRQERRLERLRDALVALSAGEQGLSVGIRGRDTLGRIAGMVEEVSRAMARDRQRLAALRNLSTWQEAARRQAHEIRTPLTAARLELERLQGRAAEPEEVRQAAASLTEELERLARFTRQFTSFARLPQPRLEEHDLGCTVEEFATTFKDAWPGLTLRFEPPPGAVCAIFDRELVRQVLVNLCDNSAQALRDAARDGTIRFRLVETPATALLEVTDDGPGIAPEVRGRVFDPYVTTRTVGQGMGLGLAISKKILLDHGGDLELAEGDGPGATFLLTLPKRETA